MQQSNNDQEIIKGNQDPNPTLQGDVSVMPAPTPNSQPPTVPPPSKSGIFGRIFRKKEAFQSVSNIKKQPLNGPPAPTPNSQPPTPNSQPPSVPPPPIPNPQLPTPNPRPSAPVPLPTPNSQPLPSPQPPAVPPPIGKAAIITRGTKRIKMIIGVILGLALASAAVFFLFFYRVQISIAPTGGADRIVLDGKEMSSGMRKIVPGKHSIVISKEGYITYRQSEDFKINQRLNINFPLLKATEPIMIESGATNVSAASTTKLIYYQLSDGRIASVATEQTTAQFKGYPITNGSYLNAKRILYSDDNSYALIQSSDGIKAVNFTKTDALNQVEAGLPLDASKVQSITWNVGSTSYVSAPNSKVIYDLQDSNVWSLMESDTTFAKSEILMRLDKSKFSSISLDWSNNPKQVLIVGQSAGVLDVATRHWEEIVTKIKLNWGGWGPKGKYAILLDEGGESYLLKNYQLTKLNLKTKPQLISWSSDSKAIIMSDGLPSEVNFDTDERINYAEINGLENATSATVQKGRIFFSDNEGVKTAPLTENVYPMAKIQ